MSPAVINLLTATAFAAAIVVRSAPTFVIIVYTMQAEIVEIARLLICFKCIIDFNVSIIVLWLIWTVFWKYFFKNWTS